MKLLKLYSSPEIFKAIEFHDGVNLIMGERLDDVEIKRGRKTNGVGKSLCVEFINFCLLKSIANSRVSKIPLDKFDRTTRIMLDLEVNSQPLTIIRTRGDLEGPSIVKDGKEIIFSNLEDASEYLEHLLFSGMNEVGVSFREFMGPFMREEGSEFKDIMMCYEGLPGRSVPLAIKPNAFLFGIDVSVIEKIQEKFKTLDGFSKHKGELKKSLTENGTKKISDVKATLNALNNELKRIDGALESFKSNEAYASQQGDLVQIQIEIDDLRSKQSALQYQLKRIKSLPVPEDIRKKDMEIVYNQFKSGLGDLVLKSVDEVLVFKRKIDEFQNRLFNEKATSLVEELNGISEKLKNLEEKRVKILQVIDQKGVLKDMKTGFAIYHKKSEEVSGIRNSYSSYERVEKKIKDTTLEKDLLFQELDAMIFSLKEVIEDFNQTILIIHERIMASSEASFDIKTVTTGKSKQILQFEMRIDDDGSHSIDRTKVFIYDLSLLFNRNTEKRHPHFLIHDNIFDVDQDSLVESLNYLASEDSPSFQYVLTLNRDKIENEEAKNMLHLDIKGHRVANFTKKDRFLYGKKYSEI